ncbi:ATP-binding protein [Planctomycetes bacterium K23_9]|uniref:histidine kinase n=1 Tax=Stieleria marina TaxID=1930275 RepID=A0A517NX15_9BACT|nr:Sensor protein ZraS [Planctomycetes bacterium K23_9]
MASLYVVRGRDQGKHFQITASIARIGRDASSHVQLFDTEASRSHAEIRIAPDETCEMVDLGSSNGTRVNGQRINRHNLVSGDRIEIGQTLLIYTGISQPVGIDAAHRVDIVRQTREDDGSRIVSSLSQVVPKPAELNAAIESGKRDTDTDRSLEVMYLTAIAVGRTDDLDQVLNRILRLVFDWVDADRGCIMLRDNESNQLRPAARCDRDDSNATKSARMSISYTILDYVLKRKEGVRTSNAKDDDRFDSAASIVHGGVREALCVPLQGRYDIVGALYIDTFTPPGKMIAAGSVQRFTDDHLRLITAIGHQAALAIEDTFYYSALVQSERLAAMGQTIATLSHHVKNILQGIRGGGYLIETGLEREDTDAVRRGWRIVDKNQDRISNLVMDMLTFSKEREPERVEADLNEQVRDVVELMQTHASDLGVQLKMQLDGELPEAYFDPDAMHRAILNLVTNAIDAAAEAAADEDEPVDYSDSLLQSSLGAEPPPPAKAMVPKVMVRTSFDSVAGWLIDVLDNGRGVAEEDRNKIFSLFESRKGARGTGLGLPVSNKILREHGGDIQILDAKGGGACFRLRLPCDGTDWDLRRQSKTNI